MTDYVYSKVAVYAELGGALRLARNARSFATDPVTGAPVNVTQGAFTAPYLDTDSSGIADFTATTPGPIRLTTGATFVDVYSEQLPGDLLAAASSAAASAAAAALSASLVGAPADTAIAAIVGNPASATRVSLSSTYGRLFQVNVADYATPQLAANAVAAGGRLFFPPATYTLTAPIQIPVDNVFVDALGATFTQTTWATAVFDLLGVSGTTLDIGLAQFVGTRGGLAGSYRGSSSYTFGAAVWCNGDRTHVRNLHVTNLALGVNFSSWDGVSAVNRIGVANKVGKVEVEGSNFGILWSGQQGLTIEDLYVHDDIDDSGGTNPTHAYYGSGNSTLRASGITIKKARAENILTGQAFQLKYADGVSLSGHTARNCAGLIGVTDCDDLTWDGMAGTALLASTPGLISFQFTTAPSKRPSLTNTSIVAAANVDARTVSITADYAQINGFAVTVDHSSGVDITDWDVIFRGTGGRVRGATLRSNGAGHAKGITFGYGTDLATGWVIEDPIVNGQRSVVDVTSGSTAFLRYIPALQTLTGAGAMTSGPVTIVSPSVTAPDIQFFTSSGTWTKPAGAVTVTATLIPGGGGGASGRRGAAGTVRCGGGGGPAGEAVFRQFRASDLGSTESVTVGIGGVGGAAVTTNDTDGSAGGRSSTTSLFGTKCSAPPGSSSSAGGTNAAGGGGLGALGGSAGTGASASTTGGAGVGTNASPIGAGGGASGGGITSANVAGAGAAANGSYLGNTSGGGTGGVVDSTAPTGGTAVTVWGTPGPGAGSGAASITTAAQAGADAVNYGGGGGGGGASLNGNNSGKGGAGGPGAVLIVSSFQ